MLVLEFGGKCQLCGYDKSSAALHFHHIESNKKFGLGDGQTRSLKLMRSEAKKCILICANCHAEIHASLV